METNGHKPWSFNDQGKTAMVEWETIPSGSLRFREETQGKSISEVGPEGAGGDSGGESAGQKSLEREADGSKHRTYLR
jgi:hypothetical protein